MALRKINNSTRIKKNKGEAQRLKTAPATMEPSSWCHKTKHEDLRMPFRLQIGLDIEKGWMGRRQVLKDMIISFAHRFQNSEKRIQRTGK